MGEQNGYLISVSPFRTPISLRSERVGGDDEGPGAGLSALIAPLLEHYDIRKSDWGAGYGTTRQDDLPHYFRPLLELEPHRLDGHEALRWGRVFLFDDGIGVLFLAFDPGAFAADTEGDLAVNAVTETFFRTQLLPGLTATHEAIERADKMPGDLVKPSASGVFTALRTLPERPFWVARARLLGAPEQVTPELWNWIEASSEQRADLVGAGVAIGLGNTLYWSDGAPMEDLVDDFLKANSFCQFFSTLLLRFQNTLRGDFRDFDSRRTISAPNRRRLERRLDHLVFVKLQHERALYGFQGRRKKIVQLIEAEWGVARQHENAMGWATALKERIGRDFRNRQRRQGRVIRGMLGFVGAVSLLDIALALKDASTVYADDGVPGILDLIGSVPADAALFVAMMLIVLAVTSGLRGE